MTAETTETQGRAGFSQRVFARIQASGESPEYHAAVEGYKRRLFGDLHGTVVELGAGTGENFGFLPKDARWIGVEPNLFMHPYLKAAAEKHGVEPDIRALVAERLPLDDNSVDAVFCSLVFCSVNDQNGALREILRVLKPGGRFAFIEHVAAPRGTWTRRWQRFVRPVWSRLLDGCQPDRETHNTIRNAGFASVELEHFRAPVFLASPHIAGIAVK
jgi:ubiquinone/menaquinone biosynthesis C-methylase UbiE